MKNIATISILLIVYAAYSGWIYTSATVTAVPMPPAARQGKQLWQQLNCQTCHQLYGLGGYMGPDLTTVTSDKNRGIDFARGILLSGGRQMPNYHLSTQNAELLLAYLTYINSTKLQ